MGEPLNPPIENPKPGSRRRKVAAYLAPIVATGSLMYGAVKWAEAATQQPKALPVAASVKPAFPIPKVDFDKVYMAHQGEEANDIISETYPNLDSKSNKYIKLRNMANNQISGFDEYNRGHHGRREVPIGQTEPIQLTSQAKIPVDETLAFYIGDYKYAKKIGSGP